MFGTKALKSIAASLAAGLLYFGYSGPTVAQATTNQDAQMRILQQRIDDMGKQLKQMQDEQTKTTKTVTTVNNAWNTFIKGFFGTLDVSIDYTTKGMNNFIAYHYNCNAAGMDCVQGAPKAPSVSGAGTTPFGNVGWMAMMSSNGSNVGYRGTHKIGTSNWDFIYQVSTSLDMAAAPGLNNTWTKSSNTVQGALGLGDTFIGLRKRELGTLKFGEMYSPYKTSTDRLNAFAGMLGNYSTIMGNTGGDNRIEFGTRMDHIIVYDSPNFGGFSFDASYSLGQNVDPYNNLPALGSVDCNGGNIPGSGNLLLNCDDGGFNYSYGGDLKFEFGGLYLVAAYELHNGVNRSSDGIGSNNPIYGAMNGAGNFCNTNLAPGAVPSGDPRLDCAPGGQYATFISEFPSSATAGSPPYSVNYDVANEWAMKFGGQYHFDFGLTVSYLYEDLHRDVPADMEFQNERQRTGQWAQIEYEFPGGADRIAAGWAHAGATVGDPGGQHNFNPNGIGDNEANMVTVAYWHKFDKQLTWYFNYADTMNDGNAHFDIGAGSHGIKTDCHDATHTPFIDYSSAGPTTWGGCHEQGLSTGLNFKF